MSRTETREDDASDGEPAVDPPINPEAPPSSLPAAGRLSSLYLHSIRERHPPSNTRRGSLSQPSGPLLLFARVDDPGLRLRRHLGGFELSGQASPERGRHERRLAVAFEGELFAVVIQPSESPREILDRLRERLSLRYDLCVEETSPSTLVASFVDRLLPTG